MHTPSIITGQNILTTHLYTILWQISQSKCRDSWWSWSKLVTFKINQNRFNQSSVLIHFFINFNFKEHVLFTTFLVGSIRYDWNRLNRTCKEVRYCLKMVSLSAVYMLHHTVSCNHLTKNLGQLGLRTKFCKFHDSMAGKGCKILYNFHNVWVGCINKPQRHSKVIRSVM